MPDDDVPAESSSPGATGDDLTHVSFYGLATMRWIAARLQLELTPIDGRVVLFQRPPVAYFHSSTFSPRARNSSARPCRKRWNSGSFAIGAVGHIGEGRSPGGRAAGRPRCGKPRARRRRTPRSAASQCPAAAPILRRAWFPGGRDHLAALAQRQPDDLEAGQQGLHLRAHEFFPVHLVAGRAVARLPQHRDRLAALAVEAMGASRRTARR